MIFYKLVYERVTCYLFIIHTASIVYFESHIHKLHGEGHMTAGDSWLSWANFW